MNSEEYAKFYGLIKKRKVLAKQNILLRHNIIFGWVRDKNCNSAKEFRRLMYISKLLELEKNND